MSNSSAVRPPTWPGLHPRIPEPEALPPDQERRLLADLGTAGHLTGLRIGQADLCHFRLDREGGQSFFLKVVKADRCNSVMRAEAIAAWIGRRNSSVVSVVDGFPKVLADGRVVVATPFINGRRVGLSVAELAALAATVADLQLVLASHPDREAWRQATSNRLLLLSAVRRDIASGQFRVGPRPDLLQSLAADRTLDFVHAEWEAVPLHGDINPGNVLVSSVNGRMLLLDFEDVFHSVLPPVFEFALIVERFILVPCADDSSAETYARALLESYRRAGGAKLSPGRGGGSSIMRSLALRSLCTLAEGERDGVTVGKDEWLKFFDLEHQACQRGDLIDRIFSE